MRPLRPTLQAKLAGQMAQLPEIQEIRMIPHSAPAGAGFPRLCLGQAERLAVRLPHPQPQRGEPGGSPDPLNKPRNGGIECQKIENETKP